MPLCPEFTLSLSPRAPPFTRSRGMLAHLLFCRGWPKKSTKTPRVPSKSQPPPFVIRYSLFNTEGSLTANSIFPFSRPSVFWRSKYRRSAVFWRSKSNFPTPPCPPSRSRCHGPGSHPSRIAIPTRANPKYLSCTSSVATSPNCPIH